MNYQKIYQDFITSRREREAAIVGYSEKHHIVPKALGGGNEKANLIRLTPEDHFFAHLLLAKTHGGVLWSPIAIMSGGNFKSYKPTQSRLLHGWATRKLSESKKGEGAYQFDKSTHKLIDEKGNIWEGLQSEMPAALGLSKSLCNMVIKGSVSVAKGWSLFGAERKTQFGSGHQMFKPAVIDFCHADGRWFSGTQFDFSIYSGLHRPAVCKIVSGESKVWNGWFLKGAVLPTTGRGAKWAKMLQK